LWQGQIEAARMRRTSPRSRFVAAALALTGAALSTGGPASLPARAGDRYTKTVSHPAGGLTFIKMHDSLGPNRIRILRVDPESQMTLDVALSNDVLPGRETTSSMVARHNAIAGINASFGNSWGRPLGVFAEDGSLKASPYTAGGNVSFSQSATEGLIGHYPLKVRGRTRETHARWRVADWNDPNEDRERIAGFTHAAGGAVDPEGNSCAMRLAPRSALKWNGNGREVGRTYVVKKVQCADAPLALGRGVVLGSRRGSPGAAVISAHSEGQHVKLTWSVGLPGVMDSVGGTPVLVNEGAVIDQCEGYVCQRHPRTGVGVTANGKVLLVTVDGRSSISVGMTVIQFARLMKRIGAVNAVNMDGGGSTTMVLKGRLVNHPSDSGGQRAVSSAVIVLKGQDADEPSPKGILPAESTSTLDGFLSGYRTKRGSGDRAIKDPASTGGLLDALARGGFGDAPVDLDGDLHESLVEFRRSTR
jgi:hypothetical protein